jgi:uncharacterized protein (UPF0147 family)
LLSIALAGVSISVLAILTSREHMNDRSNEVIKQLNRLANDRSLTLNVRNKVRDALHHIQDLNLKLKEFECDPIIQNRRTKNMVEV